MTKIILSIFILLIIFASGIFFLTKKQQSNISEEKKVVPSLTQATTTNMNLTSSGFANNQAIPSKYTCDGQNVNPPLTISEVPGDAKSLALIMDDPDAPAGTWVHWTIWNIDPTTKEIAEKSVPGSAIEGKTSFGKPGYGGPCPPSSTHHYFFKLYALDTTLSISNYSTKEDLEKAMEGHIIDKTELIGLYSRR